MRVLPLLDIKRCGRVWVVCMMPLGLALLASCAAPPARGSGAAQSPAATATAAVAASPGPKGQAKTQLTFVDLDGFDKQLEQALASGAPEVEIGLIAGMSPNQIAPRLGRWLNTVQENGGEVTVTGAVRTRSLGLLATLGEAAFKAWNEQRLRNLVKGVSAEVALSGERIERVTLRRR